MEVLITTTLAVRIMSISRKGRKIKLTNPVEQPQISQFTVEIGQSQTTRHREIDEAITPTSSPTTELKGKKEKKVHRRKNPSHEEKKSTQ